MDSWVSFNLGCWIKAPCRACGSIFNATRSPWVSRKRTRNSGRAGGDIGKFAQEAAAKRDTCKWWCLESKKWNSEQRNKKRRQLVEENIKLLGNNQCYLLMKRNIFNVFTSCCQIGQNSISCDVTFVLYLLAIGRIKDFYGCLKKFSKAEITVDNIIIAILGNTGYKDLLAVVSLLIICIVKCDAVK